MPSTEETSFNFNKSFRAGEERAFDWLFRNYFAPLSFFAGSYLKNEEESKDIVQDCFIKLWNKCADIKNPGSLKSYLYTMVRNACIDKLNARKKEINCLDALLRSAELWEDSGVDEVIHAEMIDKIHLLIAALPEKMQQVFRLYYLHGKNYAEIASELHTSPETIRKQRTRAIAILKGKLSVILLLACFFSFI